MSTLSTHFSFLAPTFPPIHLCLASCVFGLVSCVVCLSLVDSRCCPLSLVSCLLSLVSCLLSLVSCLLSLVSCLLSLVSCLLSLFSFLLCLVSCALCLVLGVWSHVARLFHLVSCLESSCGLCLMLHLLIRPFARR